MATTMESQHFQPEPRPSTETDRRHLLSQSESTSRATSIYDSGEQTPRAHSPPPAYDDKRRATVDVPVIERPYRGFPSEAAYLAAFAEWAESKRYVQQDTNLVGFYGETTMAEYASRPKVELGLSKKWRERKARKEARRASAI